MPVPIKNVISIFIQFQKNHISISIVTTSKANPATIVFF